MKTNKIKLLTMTAITGLTALVGLGALVHNHIKEAKADTISDLTNTTWLFNNTLDNSSFMLGSNFYLNFTSNNYQFTRLQVSLDNLSYFDYDDAPTGVYVMGSWSLEAYKTITITGGSDVTNSNLLSWLPSNATLQSGGGSEPEEPTPDTPTDSESVGTYYTFTFNYQINYYSPYNMNISSYFVQDSELTTSNMFKAITILEDVAFTSGGQTFNKIVARYFNAVSSYYLDDNGNRQVWGADGFASYQQLEYVNTTTNHVEVVNKRLYQPFNTNTASGYVPMLASQWIAPQYQVITFAEPVSELLITQLSKFNNATSLNGNTYTAYNEAGVTGAFELMSLAFTSWLPILSIQVLPNISLGLLILLPLMVGIVILIIWVVKR